MQGLINLPSDRKHKPNLGAPHILVKLRREGERKNEDSTNAIKNTYNIFVILSVSFSIYKEYRNYNAEKDFSKI